MDFIRFKKRYMEILELVSITYILITIHWYKIKSTRHFIALHVFYARLFALSLCPLHFSQPNKWVNFMFPTRKFTSIARNFQSFVKCFFFCRKEKLKNQNRFMEKMSVVYLSCKHVSFKHTPEYELKANFLIIKIKSFFFYCQNFNSPP